MDAVWAEHKTLLDGVEEELRSGVQSEAELINKAAHYILNSGGKRIRPLLLIVSAYLCNHIDKKSILLGGSIVEFIHTASLLHDDVIDNAEIRRGIAPARVLWGNQASILVGDYLYTLALSLTLNINNMEINTLLANTCLRMAEGEMLQLTHNNDLNLSETTYFKIIEYKTSSLISASCQFGAILAKAPEKEKKALAQYGRNLGIAFQVADDTLDYIADHRRFGKSLGKDLKEGKITLPLLHLIRHCSSKEKIWLEKMIAGKAFVQEDLKKAIDLMTTYGSIEYATKRAQDFAESAKSDLCVFDEVSHRNSLFMVADYVVQRDH
ncbi:polyprenyl synthetase family protein [Nitrospira defluvii]|nr:polyprenyl synthetase family protein [Nitrospira defluvii]